MKKFIPVVFTILVGSVVSLVEVIQAQETRIQPKGLETYSVEIEKPSVPSTPPPSTEPSPSPSISPSPSPSTTPRPMCPDEIEPICTVEDDVEVCTCPEDNCPTISNPEQADRDEDGVGNACDNCPKVFNPLQSDNNNDGRGDVCEPCPNGQDIKCDVSGECSCEFACPNNVEPTCKQMDNATQACVCLQCEDSETLSCDTSGNCTCEPKCNKEMITDCRNGNMWDHWVAACVVNVGGLTADTIFHGTYEILAKPGQNLIRDDGYNQNVFPWVKSTSKFCQDGDMLCGCIRKFACFDPDTKITMGDKTERPISEISAGDYVWNPVLKKSVRVKEVIEGPEPIPMVEFGYEGVLIRVTQGHPVPVLNKSEKDALGVGITPISLNATDSVSSSDELFGYRLVKKASDLVVGDVIKGSDGIFHEITTIRELPVAEGQYVVNFALDVNTNNPLHHFVLANGIVTGDLDMQTQLSLE